MLDPAPYFADGDRVFSHYAMSWGTVAAATATDPSVDGRPRSTWYRIVMDSGTVETLDDGGARWDFGRIMPESVAIRFGYGRDPR